MKDRRIDGTFKIEVNTKKRSCSLTDSAGATVANFMFQNPNQKGLDGSAMVTDSLQIDGDAAMGTITVDEDSDNATVDVSGFAESVADVDVTPADVTALTGHYVITKMDIPAAAKKLGYQTVQTEAEMQAERDATGNDNGGPPNEYPLFMKIVHGTNATGQDVYGILVWQHQSVFDACGGVVGATAAEIKDGLGVTFDTNMGDFAYSSTASINGTTHTLTDGWKSDQATSSWSMNDCEPLTSGKDHLWACYDAVSLARDIGRGGGCFKTGSTNPADVDWVKLEWGNGTCTNTTTAVGFDRSECKHTLAPFERSTTADITCIHEHKVEVPLDKTVAQPSAHTKLAPTPVSTIRM